MAIREQVSGAGANSKRTDLNVSKQPVRYISGGSYGAGKEMMDLQQGAGMYQASQPSMGQANVMNALRSARPIKSLTSPTDRPNEPLTSGVDIGRGVGSDALILPEPQRKTLKSIIEQLIPFDLTGEISAIYNFLRDRDN